MNKAEILDYFKGINFAYNNCGMHDVLSNMLDEMEQEIRNKAIDEFAHELKETLNRDIPLNYESTRPYFTLENARILVDEIAEQMKEV